MEIEEKILKAAKLIMDCESTSMDSDWKAVCEKITAFTSAKEMKNYADDAPYGGELQNLRKGDDIAAATFIMNFLEPQNDYGLCFIMEDYKDDLKQYIKMKN